MLGRILLIGVGDLGFRLARRLASADWVGELVVGVRSPARKSRHLALLRCCSQRPFRVERLDAAEPLQVEKLLRRLHPSVVIQCACLFSPWALPTRQTPTARTLLSAGFGAQLAAQLPLIHSVMLAARQIGFDGRIVNCSYPDLTHPVLARRQLQPDIGVGNVAMLAAKIRAQLTTSARSSGAAGAPPRVRVIGHHGHVSSVMQSDFSALGDEAAPPRVYLGESAERADALAFEGPALSVDHSLNELTAATAVPVVRALMPGARPLRTCAPGPNGQPGGYPVRIDSGRIYLDLPDDVDADEARSFCEKCAALDGIARVDAEGTVYFTERSRQLLRSVNPRLAEPLAFGEWEERLTMFRDSLQLTA